MSDAMTATETGGSPSSLYLDRIRTMRHVRNGKERVIEAILFVAAGVFFVLATKARGRAEDARVLADLEAKKVLETAKLQAEAEVRKAQASAQKAELDAKEQFLKLYPGSNKIRVELIKELFRVGG